RWAEDHDLQVRALRARRLLRAGNRTFPAVGGRSGHADPGQRHRHLRHDPDARGKLLLLRDRRGWSRRPEPLVGGTLPRTTPRATARVWRLRLKAGGLRSCSSTVSPSIRVRRRSIADSFLIISALLLTG